MGNRAQDLSDLAGKVIRITDEGQVPPDNPFVGQSGVRPEIYTHGNRNSQGLTLEPYTGQIWESEHGPKGGDEINLLLPGSNYGWPVITYGRSYAGGAIGEGTHKTGMEQPLRYWVPSISPSGMTFYTRMARRSSTRSGYWETLVSASETCAKGQKVTFTCSQMPPMALCCGLTRFERVRVSIRVRSY
jgi:glucose/arabinose dehydrogenase